ERGRQPPGFRQCVSASHSVHRGADAPPAPSSEHPTHLHRRAPMSWFDATLNRRHLLRAGAVSTAVSLSGWLRRLAQATAADPANKPKRSCILLWMNGGPATIDLWDRKLDHENGGPYKEIATNAPGLRIGEVLPKMADYGDRLAVLRGMSTKEGD